MQQQGRVLRPTRQDMVNVIDLDERSEAQSWVEMGKDT
jgi:hypothetical protein